MSDILSAADKRIQLTAGVRLQQVQGANFNAASGTQTSNYDASALSPSLSLVLKPWGNVSVYSTNRAGAAMDHESTISDGVLTDVAGDASG